MLKYKEYGVLLALALLYLTGNVLWYRFQVNDFMTGRDEAIHVYSAKLMSEDIDKRHFVQSVQRANAPIPPLLTVGLLAFGKKHLIRHYALYINFIYFLAALWGTYKIGEYLSGKRAGILAACLLSLYPGVFGLSRIYGHGDFPVMAAMACNILCLLKSDTFKNVRWSVLYGISAGAGLMVKDTFIAFFAPPLAVSLFTMLTTERDRKATMHMFVALAAGALIAAPHYANGSVLKKVMYDLATESHGAWYEPHNLRVYTIGLWEELLSPPFFVVFLCGLFGFLKKRLTGDRLMVLLWFVVPWGVLLLMPHRKATVYGIPYVPAIAIMSAIGLMELHIPRLKYIVLCLGIVGVIQYADFSYGWGPGLSACRSSLPGTMYYYRPNTEIVCTTDPRRERYSVMRAILEKKLKDYPSGHRVLVAIENDKTQFIDPIVLGVIGWLYDYPLFIPVDSIYLSNLDPRRSPLGGIDMIVYIGDGDFATPEYFNGQYRAAFGLAHAHPAFRDTLRNSLIGMDTRSFNREIEALRRSFKHRETVYIDDQVKAIIYAR